MKKRYLLIALLLLPLLIVNVHASSAPYEWIVGGEKVNADPNSAGTAKLEKEGKKVTLYLNNYDGGQLELNCYGTGQSDMEFIIYLEGDNKVKSDNIGIDMGESNSTKLVFEGSGKITITAPTPISNEDYKDSVTLGNAEEETDEITQITVPEEDEKTLVSEKESDNNNLIYIIFGIYVAISLVVIILLSVKVLKK